MASEQRHFVGIYGFTESDFEADVKRFGGSIDYDVLRELVNNGFFGDKASPSPSKEQPEDEMEIEDSTKSVDAEAVKAADAVDNGTTAVDADTAEETPSISELVWNKKNLVRHWITGKSTCFSPHFNADFDGPDEVKTEVKAEVKTEVKIPAKPHRNRKAHFLCKMVDEAEASCADDTPLDQDMVRRICGDQPATSGNTTDVNDEKIDVSDGQIEGKKEAPESDVEDNNQFTINDIRTKLDTIINPYHNKVSELQKFYNDASKDCKDMGMVIREEEAIISNLKKEAKQAQKKLAKAREELNVLKLAHKVSRAEVAKRKRSLSTCVASRAQMWAEFIRTIPADEIKNRILLPYCFTKDAVEIHMATTDGKIRLRNINFASPPNDHDKELDNLLKTIGKSKFGACFIKVHMKIQGDSAKVVKISSMEDPRGFCTHFSGLTKSTHKVKNMKEVMNMYFDLNDITKDTPSEMTGWFFNEHEMDSDFIVIRRMLWVNLDD